MFATAWPPYAQTFGKLESGTVRGADQFSFVDQELAGDVVEAASLVRAAVQPRLQRRSIAIEDDRRTFAADLDV